MLKATVLGFIPARSSNRGGLRAGINPAPTLIQCVHIRCQVSATEVDPLDGPPARRV